MIVVRAQAQQQSQVTSDRFSLVLASAASVVDLEAWLTDAGAGHQAQYAAGIDLPRQLPGVQLVSSWRNAGLVVTTQRRDPADGRRWLFLCIKTALASETAALGTGGTPLAARATRFQRSSVLLEAELDKLLSLLRAATAARSGGAPCPSNAVIAKAIGLARGEAGRARARYLVRTAQMRGLIAVESRGRNEPRRVTVMEAAQ